MRYLKIKIETSLNKDKEPQITLKNANNLSQTVIFITKNASQKQMQDISSFIGKTLVKATKEIKPAYFYLVGNYETINSNLIEVQLANLVYFDTNNEEKLKQYEYAVRKLN